MLKALIVKNFALVQSLEIQFDAGMTVITGESGAGKSIILGALGLVLGDRATADSLRPGANRAEVSAEFDLLDNPGAQNYLAELSLDDPDQPGRCLVRRTLGSDARSRAFINATPVNLQLLRGLTRQLIDVHGQQEHQRLDASDVQRGLLDDYGVRRDDLENCAKAFRDWKTAQAEHSSLTESVHSREDRAALLTYQLEELSAADPQPGEFARVSREHRRQSQAQNLKTLSNLALAQLEDSNPLQRAQKELSRIDDDHPALLAARETLAQSLALADDAGRDLRTYELSLEHNPEALADLEQRLETLHGLGRKHRVEPDALPDLVAALDAELESLSTDRSALDTLARAVEAQAAAYQHHASRVSGQRHAATKGFTAAVSACMETLGIPGGALTVEFTPAETEHGLETLEFNCVTNPNYPPAPLARIASGGERARISLAIQVIAAQKSALPSLILDEADVGVGGITADVVGRLLRALAAHIQVICVTHAPQVAALGQQHLRVHKDPDQDTHIVPLAEEGRIDELARMLAGAGITEKSRDYARTLLSEAMQAPIH